MTVASFNQPVSKRFDQMPPPSASEQLAADQRLRQAEAARQSGDFAAVEAICWEVLSTRPNDPSVLQLLGVALLNQGRLDGAREAFLECLKRNPESVTGQVLLANVYLKMGECAVAESWSRKAIASNPELVQAYLVLALALHGQGRFDEEATPLREALRRRPDFAEAQLQLGVTFLAIREFGEALKAFDRTISLSPRSYEGHYSRGLALLALNRLEDAELSFARSADLNPRHGDSILSLARTRRRLRKIPSAIFVLSRALTLNDQNAEMHALLAGLLSSEGYSREALTEIEKALELSPNNTNYLLILATIESEFCRFEKARSTRQRALELAPHSMDVLTAVGYEHLAAGRKTEATKVFESLVELWPREVATYLNLAAVRKFAPGDQRFDALLKFAEDEEKLPRRDCANLHFALGKAFDEVGDYDRAFDHFSRANAVQEIELTGIEEARAAPIRELKDRFTQQFVSKRQGNGINSSLPIFILGMPRSGTTLVEQFVSMLPQVSAGGEVRDFGVALREIAFRQRLNVGLADLVAKLPSAAPAWIGEEYVGRLQERAPGAQRVTDKLVYNFQYLGLIHLALPNAKIIHCVRNPLDCCLSIFSNCLSDADEHARDLERLAHAYRRYHDLMGHWRAVLPEETFLDVRYEDMVGDFESAARRVIEYCELPWDPACLEFQRSERPVDTLSIDQVRQPIYQSSIGRWRNYERHLGPLIAGLGDLVPR